MSTSKHASIRCQQRGIPPIVVDMLIRYGQHEHDHAGVEIIYFYKRARKKVEAYSGSLIGKMSEYLDSYAVVADGNILTVGIRYKRINSN